MLAVQHDSVASLVQPGSLVARGRGSRKNKFIRDPPPLLSFMSYVFIAARVSATDDH